MTRFLFALAALSLAAVQDEKMIDNPEYKSWSGQKAGAWVKYKSQTQMGEMKQSGEMMMTLKELSAEKAVLEIKMSFEVMGQKNEHTQTKNVPAKIKEGTDSEGSKSETMGEGDEEIEIKDKKFKCHWIKKKITGKQELTLKSWLTDQIVGGSAKVEMNAEKPMKMTTTMTAVDWKAGE